ncbi:hypothetical protein YQE_08019, partial [Dendroctonus ponderosae]
MLQPHAPLRIPTIIKIDSSDVVEFKAPVQGQGQTLPRSLASRISLSARDWIAPKRVSECPSRPLPQQLALSVPFARELSNGSTRARPQDHDVPEGPNGFTFILRVAPRSVKLTRESLAVSVVAGRISSAQQIQPANHTMQTSTIVFKSESKDFRVPSGGIVSSSTSSPTTTTTMRPPPPPPPPRIKLLDAKLEEPTSSIPDLGTVDFTP